MDSWERSDETSLPGKKSFYSELYLGDITDKDFKFKNPGDYHYLYLQSDTLLLPDVFENFRNKCIEIYVLDSTHFCLHLSAH